MCATILLLGLLRVSALGLRKTLLSCGLGVFVSLAALNAIDATDRHLARILQEVEDGLHGHARDPSKST